MFFLLFASCLSQGDNSTACGFAKECPHKQKGEGWTSCCPLSERRRPARRVQHHGLLHRPPWLRAAAPEETGRPAPLFKVAERAAEDLCMQGTGRFLHRSSISRREAVAISDAATNKRCAPTGGPSERTGSPDERVKLLGRKVLELAGGLEGRAPEMVSLTI